ncbi:hypothetical protein HQ865_12245 [Mucilaginibacter mali]|uniref:Uncharacterized protein n=1 Tax=Mucilaginibacter mali TaxID=2740462 RepID=A0A7D4TVE4_9SPHI|nr:hypothetical protein [Mucilaginibacter mali]QKJ30495.1 hypothetical protein HQ865_12245 [Mucilaginibacter mali]
MMDKMKITEFEAGVLDAVLETCGDMEKLDRGQLLEIFDGDEELAASMVNLLIDAGLVEPDGLTTAELLPAWITREPEAEPFLAAGGFSTQFIKSVPHEKREIAFEIEVAEAPAEVIPIAEPLPTVPSPVATIAATEPVHTPVQSKDTTSDELTLLHREIEHLRKSEMFAEHKLREKEMQLQSLQSANKQLLNIRLFIWVLLGFIALLLILLFIRK